MILGRQEHKYKGLCEMDPVDKTFDTVYYWAQRAKRAAQGAAQGTVNVVSGSSSTVKDYVMSTVNSVRPQQAPQVCEEQSHWINVSALGVRDFVCGHKLVSVATVAVMIGAGAVAMNALSPTTKHRRRAHRLENGARNDVVLLVGSITEPLTRNMAYDLTMRGFIVYISSSDSTADNKFFAESNEDIKSLILSSELNDDGINRQQLEKFDKLLSSDHIPFQGAQPNKLNLVGIVFVPDLLYPSGKFDTITPQTWTKTLCERALVPINLLSSGLVALAEKYDSNIIFLTPTITSALNMPFHAPESITSAMLQQVSSELASDYPDLNVTTLRLGALNISQGSSKKNLGIKGDHVRHLYYKIFDLLYAEDSSKVAYAGFGARVLQYSWIPQLFISGLWSVQCLVGSLVSMTHCW